jgi:hypothetical protein
MPFSEGAGLKIASCFLPWFDKNTSAVANET